MASNNISCIRYGASYSSQRRRVRKSVVETLNSIASQGSSVLTENELTMFIDDNGDCGNVFFTETSDATVETVDVEDNYNW